MSIIQSKVKTFQMTNSKSEDNMQKTLSRKRGKTTGKAYIRKTGSMGQARIAQQH